MLTIACLLTFSSILCANNPFLIKGTLILGYAIDSFKVPLRQVLSNRLIHQVFLALNFEAELLFEKLV